LPASATSSHRARLAWLETHCGAGGDMSSLKPTGRRSIEGERRVGFGKVIV
jgi:hypothetical protein